MTDQLPGHAGAGKSGKEPVHGHCHNHFHGTGNPPAGDEHCHIGAGLDVENEKSGSTTANTADSILTLRCHSGISGDMLLCGFAGLVIEGMGITPASAKGNEWLGQLARGILPELDNAVALRRHEVAGVSGLQAQVCLPVQHVHRTLVDIEEIVARASMQQHAKELALSCFKMLAECEAAVHNTDMAHIHFHEVGALDSILDVCATCELYVCLREPRLLCSPLPIADGEIICAHGCLPAPAPAVLKLLSGVAVRPFAGNANAGELVTPTGLALLRTLQAAFGGWPEFQVQQVSLVYGQKVFSGTANGLILALGRPCVNVL